MSLDDFAVELPDGGPVHLQSQDEVDRWQTLSERYQSDYSLRKVNDLTHLGTLLIQQISLYRAQLGLSGRVPELDDEDLPTGRYIMKQLKPAEIRAFQAQITDASKEIREIEKAMGIDKKSRDSSGNETVRNYLESLKQRAHDYGVHISKRVQAYELFVNEIKWRIRLLRNGDAEDIHYEHCTPDEILTWAEEQLAELERIDQEFAKEQGRLVVGAA